MSPLLARAKTDRGWVPTFVCLLLMGIALAATWKLDRDIYHATYVGPDKLPVVEAFDWYKLFRIVGYWPTWIAIGGALILQQRPWRTSAFRAGNWGGALVIVAAGLAGGIAEALRPIVGRLRPYQTDGFHRYNGLPDDPTMHASLGGPSSHTAVAVGAACMIFFLWPRPGLIALVLAAGCAWTRMISGAHFASDVVAGAILGYACARVLPHQAGGPGGPHR